MLAAFQSRTARTVRALQHFVDYKAESGTIEPSTMRSYRGESRLTCKYVGNTKLIDASNEEIRDISAGVDESAAKVDAAIHEDFNALPSQAQAHMLGPPTRTDPGNMGFWKELLGLKMPDAPPTST